MHKTVHVQAELNRVVAIVEDALAEEGFRRAEAPTPNADQFRAIPSNMRRIVVAEQNGWVALADDPFAETDWAEVLSSALRDQPVLTLEGERDHAFYSVVSVHEEGEEAHRSEVPRDAVHENDGRHRIRPLFLAEYFPNARKNLEKGVVINPLGGEENSVAVADALALPNASLTAYDEDQEGRSALWFEYDDAAPTKRRPALQEDALTAMMRAATTQLGPEDLKTLAFGSAEEMMKALASSFAAVSIDEVAELALEATSTGGCQGYVGDAYECHLTFRLTGGSAEEDPIARGLTLRITGAGLAGAPIDRIRIVPAVDIGQDTGRWDVSAKKDDAAIVARVKDIVLEIPAPDSRAATLPASERMRRSMNAPMAERFAPNTAEVVVYLAGRFKRKGKIVLEVEASTTASDRRALTAKTECTLEALPALRVPVLPPWMNEARLLANRHAQAQYVGSDNFAGWTAFDRKWTEIGDDVVAMAADLSATLLAVARAEPQRERVEFDPKTSASKILAALKRGADVIIRGPTPMRATLRDDTDDTIHLSTLEEDLSPRDGFAADVLLKGGERLAFLAPVVLSPKDDHWKQIAGHLARGADVTLRAGGIDSAYRVDIRHQPDGSNHFPDRKSAARYPRIELAWRCPRPKNKKSARSLGAIAADVLARAGRIAKNVGGVAYAGGSETSSGSFTTPYEELIGTRLASGSPKWLATHVRGPGHCVLLPLKAASQLGKTPKITRKKLAHGILLGSAGDDPFTSDREPMERAVLPLVGTAKDAQPA